ncbi:hypothetical protein COW36_14760 [bacterium (Candidatus Blackallbacteria) CG17_big_fil_post_rev_8_21_14_2_50_48_46]|uniref:Uncharacterized protein n=1 Tax=bacterium (Candidatus Blackallbacteria) CG17_big_fil_post_rev_8_21_14_2_50_48_46 TaxID=2014261 RepID=A0A2M7G2N9_9BACT|nr:MAG: hypothetical protein COW64_11790 [bacterium (Candidatus Blackallbacteria) CG18_big_fil_WC_8_21_14_2_50_49_26]PIW15975.1 MAG: hypothetical protein COW36_14760 [bacterium (Candidatus Blackallbacteria) CG17_big_fil_post_rev_8_21_14_2_50_48_46]PIW50387.1 MAG: hypothetical protein COW20_02475 [bacterium (Candidatus Blackallbacteria) CG13_big_fil_rev_8_21_14_2_50_49_14]
MTTTATGRIGFGGSGFGPEYISRRKRSVEHQDEKRDSSSGQGLLRRNPEEDLEVFLFTVKDPVRSALNQLMQVIHIAVLQNPTSREESLEIVSGPLGYTSMKAVRPVAFIPTRSVFKPVLR